MSLTKHLSRQASVLLAALAICFTFAMAQSIHADLWAVGVPITNFTSKICTPAPVIFITIHEMSVSRESIVREKCGLNGTLANMTTPMVTSSVGATRPTAVIGTNRFIFNF